jgi:type II secretory pathway component PulJ
MSSHFRKISAREEGFTIIELMMVCVLLMIVMTSILTAFGVIQTASVRESARSEESDQVRIAMERLSKEVRQAIDVRVGSSESFLDVDTYVNAEETHISYTASGTTLTRTVDGETTTMLERLSTTDVFAYDPDVTDPSVVTITLAAKPEFYKTDATVITLTSEIKLRNGGSA